MEQTKLDLINIKEKLIEQIKTQYDETQAKSFIEKINEMNDEQFIEFLKQQEMIPGEGKSNPQCIFCSMISGNIPTTKIGENDFAITILEINPITQGHSLIIPKAHVEAGKELDEGTLELSKQTLEKLNKTFNPLRIDLVPGEVMGHQIINALPIYNNETLESPRQQKKPEELAQLKKQIEDAQPQQINAPSKSKVEEIPEETEEEINETNTWLPKRIP